MRLEDIQLPAACIVRLVGASPLLQLAQQLERDHPCPTTMCNRWIEWPLFLERMNEWALRSKSEGRAGRRADVAKWHVFPTLQE